MKLKDDNFDVGVIVGRFQVPDLHAAHRELIQHVCDQHGKVLVFLGVSPLWATRENPLDFEARKQMILASFPNVNVFYIKDVPSDELWSQRLDEQIGDMISPRQTAVLYGGRDSFIGHYSGSFPTREFQQDVWVSGNEIRKNISRRSTKASADFRAGACWAAGSRFPTAFTTVDIAIFNDERRTRVLLGRKAQSKVFQFIGGFAEPNSDCFEDDAHREVREEAGIEIRDLDYLGSFKIDDWRYRSEDDKIKTLFFRAYIVGGSPRPGDDIAEVRWFELDKLTPADVAPQHHPLLAAIQS